jgi:hypothetical protein
MVVERFVYNYKGFWGRYWLFALIFFVALLCDGFSTIYFMLGAGPESELHPAVKIVSYLFGPVVGPLVGVLCKGFFGVLVAIYLRRFAGYIFLVVAILSFWAAWYNVWGSELYVPLFMKWFLL